MKRKLGKTLNIVAGLLWLLSLVLLVFSFSWAGSVKAAPPQASHGQGVIHRDDPCDHIPADLPNAKEIARICHGAGSSSGVSLGDFNGDGFADLAIGIPDEDTPSTVKDSGAVVVIYGSANGLTTNTAGIPAPQFWSQNTTGVPGPLRDGNHFGWALASGDFNGDGYSDLAIGVPDQSLSGFFAPIDAGQVVIIYGSSHGLTRSDTSVPAPQSFDLSDVDNNKDWSFAELGTALAWGDFNGDGIGDLAIGAPGEANVWVLYGTRGSGLALASNRLFSEEDVSGLFNNGHFGSALAAGDFNGDGRSDLAIGIPDWSQHCSVCATTPVVGQVDVISGGPNGLDPANPGRRIYREGSGGLPGTPTEGDKFGAALTAGDFNGDGKDDLAIGVPGKDNISILDAGAVHVIYGTSTGLSLSITGNQFWRQSSIGQSDQAGDAFGSALAAGDFNGDGKKDLAIGVPLKDVLTVVNGFNTLVTNAGAVDVIYGSSGGLSTTAVRAPQVWRQGITGVQGSLEDFDHFGASLTAWNFGRNEFVNNFGQITIHKTADLAIGVPGASRAGIAGAGAVNVIYGSFLSNGLTTSGSALFAMDIAGMPASPQAGAHFGAALY